LHLWYQLIIDSSLCPPNFIKLIKKKPVKYWKQQHPWLTLHIIIKFTLSLTSIEGRWLLLSKLCYLRKLNESGIQFITKASRQYNIYHKIRPLVATGKCHRGEWYLWCITIKLTNLGCYIIMLRCMINLRKWYLCIVYLSKQLSLF